jgi:hypothetical protein
MSTNIGPEAQAAREEYQNANTLEEKVDKLEIYISLIPKHKATEKMVAMLRSRLVKLRKELEDKKQRQKKLSKGPTWVIAKEGDAQVCLVGVANAGKTQLLHELTGSKKEGTDYPFSTEKPEPGVLDCKGAIIQIIDLPSMFENIRTEYKNGAMLLSQIRAADLIIFVIDLSQDPIKQMELLLEELEDGGIKVNQRRPDIELRKTGSGGALIIGEEKIDASRKEILEILHNQSYYNFSLKIKEDMKLMDLVEAMDQSLMYSTGIIIANKGDISGSKKHYQQLQAQYGKQFPIYPVSVLNKQGLENLDEKIFEHLDLARVKSKEPNGDIAKKPIVVKKGSTVGDVAKIIHTRFYDHFRTAKITGPSAKFDGQSVGLSHEVADGDIVEIFTE